MDLFYVYVLVKNKVPVYAGLTQNITKRMQSHKKSGKQFDSYEILYQSGYKERALLVERSYIDFIRTFYLESYNKQVTTMSKILIK